MPIHPLFPVDEREGYLDQWQIRAAIKRFKALRVPAASPFAREAAAGANGYLDSIVSQLSNKSRLDTQEWREILETSADTAYRRIDADGDARFLETELADARAQLTESKYLEFLREEKILIPGQKLNLENYSRQKERLYEDFTAFAAERPLEFIQVDDEVRAYERYIKLALFQSAKHLVVDKLPPEPENVIIKPSEIPALIDCVKEYYAPIREDDTPLEQSLDQLHNLFLDRMVAQLEKHTNRLHSDEYAALREIIHTHMLADIFTLKDLSEDGVHAALAEKRVDLMGSTYHDFLCSQDVADGMMIASSYYPQKEELDAGFTDLCEEHNQQVAHPEDRIDAATEIALTENFLKLDQLNAARHDLSNALIGFIAERNHSHRR